MKDILENDYIESLLLIIAFSYGALSRPDIPDFIIKIFETNISKIIFLSILLKIRFDVRATVAVIISSLFVYSINILNSNCFK